MIFVAFDDRPAETINRLAKTAKKAPAHVFAVISRKHGPIPNANQSPNLHILHNGAHPVAEPIQDAVQFARRMEMTHIVFLHPVRHLTIEDITSISDAIQSNPAAVIVGRSAPAAKSTSRLSHWRRSLATFCYRLQTGRQLDDVNSGLYAFPLNVIEALPWSHRPDIFMIQAPVKPAWAGVDIEQTFVSSIIKNDSGPEKVWAAIGNAIVWGMMTLHLTMRAITPWPHRKITKDKSKPGKNISVIHPLRSIKTLLTENTTPWQLCLATALGVFIGALPLIAAHTIAILFAAGYFRLNKVAALTASQLCMPPIVPAICIEAGYFMRFGNFLTEISLKTIGYQAIDRLYEWLIGSLLLGPLLAAIAGAVVYFLAILARRKLMEF